MELKGSGNVQSTLKTFTSSESSTSNTGTTTIATADNSTVAVSDSAHTFVGTFLDTNRSAAGGPSFTDFNTTVKRPQDGSNSARRANPSYYSTSFATSFGGVGLDNDCGNLFFFTMHMHTQL